MKFQQKWSWLGLLICTLCAGSGGCSWLTHMRHTEGPLPPPAFAGPPQLNEIIAAVNANSEAIHQLQSHGASLRVDGVPASLQAQLVVERPRRLRLTARLSGLTGREVDLGSNDELFWFWLRRNPQPAVFFARHSQFAQSSIRRRLAIDPVWLIDSLGLTRMTPEARHSGPFLSGPGRVEVRTVMPQSDGEWTKVMMIDDTYAWILEQHLYDPTGQLVASTRADRFRFYNESGVSLPHSVHLQLGPGQPTQMSLKLDVSKYVINHLSGDASQLWSMPQFNGEPKIDITSPSFQPQMLAPVPSMVPAHEHWNHQISRSRPDQQTWR